ncbi:HAD family hydrolase [Paenibacillus sp. DMB20]|uniref:HAD family hydrolase n=1 Tax=Paenibacillus sp. DMB20 TaxID=1642570 RepID=UPI000627E796|nr:HAD-IA family hydrolase [Paenibacillus sp. DMB20]KKO52721.1 haloacid dehalogenase [Paenibacillus sp. DMB20]
MKNKKIKGIIFDMDNTILRSSIDFHSMKNETFKYLVSHGILPAELDISNHTSSTIIAEAAITNRMTDALVKEMWEIPKRYEVRGMQDADLESGVIEILEELHDRYCMVVVTNNSIEAAEGALRKNGILEYFDCVVGRELMKSLKPSPDGFLYVLQRYENFTAEEWVSVGDSWIDGKASTEAGIRFISYQGDAETMKKMGVCPSAEITDIRELKRFIVSNEEMRN